MVMYIAAAILTNQDKLPELKDDDHYRSSVIRANGYSKLGYIKKSDMLAYKYLIEAVECSLSNRSL